MKRLNHIFEQFLDAERIKGIILNASEGKRSREEVQIVLRNIDYYAGKILQMFQTEEYFLKPVKNTYITDWKKPRTITISPFFPNRILDHICVEALKPYIRKSMYQYCIGNVDGRGITYGKCVILKNYKKYKYHIKLDIKKFYPSTRADNVYNFLETKIKDKRFLKFAKAVLSQNDSLPIGAYYSQWISNYYLESLDHYIKEQLRIPFYVRYVDDMLLMSNNKYQLQNAAWKIKKFLKQEKKLELKSFAYVYELEKHPIDYLGFRFYSDRIYLRKHIFKRLNLKAKRIRKKQHASASQARSLMSYLGWLKQIPQGSVYYRKHIKPSIKKGTMRKIISLQAKKETLVQYENPMAIQRQTLHRAV